MVAAVSDNTGEKMPFYKKDTMDEKISPSGSIQKGVPGKFMKAGLVTKSEGIGPPLHEQPNEEQFTLVLEGKLHYVLGDEEKIVQKGNMIHIPRGVPHRSRAVGGSVTFFTVKSPSGSGDLNEDHKKSSESRRSREKLSER